MKMTINNADVYYIILDVYYISLFYYGKSKQL